MTSKGFFLLEKFAYIKSLLVSLRRIYMGQTIVNNVNVKYLNICFI